MRLTSWWRQWWRSVAAAVGIVTLVFLAQLLGVVDWLTSGAYEVWVTQLGWWAPFIFILTYVAATVLFIPATPLTLMAGILFGPWLGTIVVVVGATGGAVLAFLIARRLGHQLLRGRGSAWSERLVRYDERLAAHGFVTVLLLRLVPLFPFNGLNFGLGLTSVTTTAYTLGTFLGIIPGTFAYVYFGASLAALNVWHIAGAAVVIVGVTIGGRWIMRYSNVTK